MLRRSKLTLRVTEAASAVCGITFHPDGMDGGLTTVTLTLLLHTTLPRLTRFFWVGRVRWPTFTIFPVFPKSHLSASPRDILKKENARVLGCLAVRLYLRDLFVASHARHLVAQQKVTTSPPEIAELFIVSLARHGRFAELYVTGMSHILIFPVPVHVLNWSFHHPFIPYSVGIQMLAPLFLKANMSACLWYLKGSQTISNVIIIIPRQRFLHAPVFKIYAYQMAKSIACLKTEGAIYRHKLHLAFIFFLELQGLLQSSQ